LLEETNSYQVEIAHSCFNLTIRTIINTTQSYQGPYVYTLFWMNSEKI
jgi:hypothetical protein